VKRFGLTSKQIIAAFIFTLVAISLSFVTPTIEITWVTTLLVLTIYLFAFEIVDVDVAAITIMVCLGLTSLFAPLMGLDKGLINNQQLFDGFASNAVMSIIAVMIIGAGLDKTGLMGKVASFILKVGGTTEKRIIPIISGTVAIISSFMQNVGATALFLPVVSRISMRSGIPLSRLLMPMGFCAILGGTVTMIGSSPLILLNDLILTSNKTLSSDLQMETFGLFAVTPIGAALVLSGIFYFIIMGRFVLPTIKKETSSQNKNAHFQDTYNIDYNLFEITVPAESSLINRRIDEVETTYKVRVVAKHTQNQDDIHIGSGVIDRDLGIKEGMVLGILASPKNLEAFTEEFSLVNHQEIKDLAEDLATTKSGIAEVVIPPSSSMIGKSARDVWMRKVYGIAMVAIYRNGKTLHEGDDIRSIPLKAGDTLVVYTTWEALMHLESNADFVIITSEYPREELRPQKVIWAGIFFTIALSLVLLPDIINSIIGSEVIHKPPLSVALFTGALGMILSGVIKIDEAYQAVSWKTVFLLASLIPLGLAVEESGTAKWIAEQVIVLLDGVPSWVMQASIAVLATFFTLVMSNVGATVLLVPLAVNIAIGVGESPAIYALTVAIATSNSFLIPTHQVNALIMGPGGYRVNDFMKAGSIMTILFLVVLIVMMNLFY